MYQTTPNKASNSLDFTNLFARLKNVQKNYNPDFATRVPLFPNKDIRERPKSMYVCRERQDQGEFNTTARVVSTIQYGRGQGQGQGHRKWFSVTAKDGAFRTRCFTQVSQSNGKNSTSGKDSLKYLAISNFCLKKIRIPQQNISTCNPKQQQPNNQIKLPIEQPTPQKKTYQRKTLRTIKRNKNMNNKFAYLTKQQNDINVNVNVNINISRNTSTRIEGHKIF